MNCSFLMLLEPCRREELSVWSRGVEACLYCLALHSIDAYSRYIEPPASKWGHPSVGMCVCVHVLGMRDGSNVTAVHPHRRTVHIAPCRLSRN